MTDRETGKLDDIVFRGRAALDQCELEVLIEQYKLFVGTSERLVARRQVVNTFFLSVNTLALSAVGFMAKEVQTSPLVAIGVVAISIAAIVLCVAWEDAGPVLRPTQPGQVRRDRPPRRPPARRPVPGRVGRVRRGKGSQGLQTLHAHRGGSSPISSWSSTGWRPY